MKRYNPAEIEPKWQKKWDEQQIYKADLDSQKPKYFAMSMFNYPSGILHIGHAMNYTISDVMARYKRQQGFESYHPVGWDSFGLPAENRAIKEGVSPQVSMAELIPKYHDLYKTMGWSNDWSKEIATHDPRYYKWTQWIFAEMFRAGLAYQEPRMQWWCEKDNTVLANEQVIDGKCWRHDAPDDPLVEKKEINQWFFKITDYADKMLEATDDLDWTNSVKQAQKNWIGKSVGAEVVFKTENDDDIPVFTTRPDTIFGATFLVLAPEHPLVEKLVTDDTKLTVDEYVRSSTKKTELERMADSKEKTGVFTGSHAINPATGEKIPIWIADYVLFGYGTGAVMAVPAHDERDYEFARKFQLPIVNVVEPETGVLQKNPEFRQSIVAIVRQPKTGKFLSLNWGVQNGGNLFIGGGRETGEELVATAVREIAEETGYINVKHVTQTGTIHHNYFAHSKNVARRIEAQALLFDLVDETRTETALEENEQGKFITEWLDEAEIIARVKDELHAISFNLLVGGKMYQGEGILTNSGEFDSMPTSEAREEVVAWLEQQGLGKSKTTYKMRDWSVSRQRYWGAPIPIVHCESCGPQLVPDDQLPVILPELEDFQPSGDGRSALARATDWLEVDCPNCGEKATRETDTLDTYICSSWYFLRYLDPENTESFVGKDVAEKWMPVDFYNGADHATAHLLYARFIARFFAETKGIGSPEPFKKFVFNGKVTAADGTMFSKSKGNGVDPLEIINSGYGADALRTYLMFAAPVDTWMRWDPQGVPGTHRFLNRVWNLTQEFLETPTDSDSDAVLGIIHPTIKKVTRDLEHQKYNTAIAAMMETTNSLYELKAKNGFIGRDNWQFALESLVTLVAPFAPHMADELWHELGNETSIQKDSWPSWTDAYLISNTMTIIVQVNGKLRAKFDTATDATRESIESQALEDENIVAHLNGSTPKKVIYIAGKLVNIVV